MGYGDDYGALSSTNDTHTTDTNHTSSRERNQENKVESIDRYDDVNSTAVLTSLGSSETDIAHDSDTEQLNLELPAEEESPTHQLQRFQLSIQANQEDQTSLAVCCNSNYSESKKKLC